MLAKWNVFKSALILLLAGCLFASSLGVSHTGMEMEGGMPDCPFMPGVSICAMTPMEMVEASQGLLQNISLQDNFALLLSLIFLTFSVSVFARFFSPPDLDFVRQRSSPLYSPRSQDYLQEAFSNGILNPKLY